MRRGRPPGRPADKNHRPYGYCRGMRAADSRPYGKNGKSCVGASVSDGPKRFWNSMFQNRSCPEPPSMLKICPSRSNYQSDWDVCERRRWRIQRAIRCRSRSRGTSVTDAGIPLAGAWQRSKFEAAVSAAHKFRAPQQLSAPTGARQPAAVCSGLWRLPEKRRPQASGWLACGSI